MTSRKFVRPRRENRLVTSRSAVWWSGILLSLSVSSAFQPRAPIRPLSAGPNPMLPRSAPSWRRQTCIGYSGYRSPFGAVTDPEVLMSQTQGEDGWTDADRERIEMLYALAAAEKELDDANAPSSNTSDDSTSAVTTTRSPKQRTRKKLTSSDRTSTSGTRSRARSGRLEFRGLSTTSNKARYRRNPTQTYNYAKHTATMPGFGAETESQKALRESKRIAEKNTGRKITESAKESLQRRKENGEAMYRSALSVPDSMVQFAGEIHNEDRITRQEEIELGAKTQEAIRLHNLYESLEEKLAREPTDQEWCAAAGKINMEAISQAIEDGIAAKDKLVTSNLRLVQSVVNTYIRKGLGGKYNAGDMMQEGILALIRAAEKFEPDRGWRFSTYAMYWVRASVKRNQVSQSRSIGIPHRLHETHKRLLRIEFELTASLDRKPTVKELAEASNLSEQQIERCLTAVAQRCFSLDQEITNGLKPNSVSNRGDSLADILDNKSEDTEEKKRSMAFLREDLVETLHRHLTPAAAELLLMRYGLKELPQSTTRVNGQPTIAELSRSVGLTPDKVRRIINKSLKQLRSANTEEWESFQRELL